MVPLAPLSAHKTLQGIVNGRKVWLVNLDTMYKPTLAGKHAIPAVNVRNMPLPKDGDYRNGYVGPSTAVAALRAMRHLNAPLVLEIAQSEVVYAGPVARHGEVEGFRQFSEHILAEADRMDMRDIPLAIHFDHGENTEWMKAAVKGGFTSVAFDGGKTKNWQDLVTKTKEWVEYCHAQGVTVEGEIETVGGAEPTDPAKAIQFVKETGVDVIVVTLEKNEHGSLQGTSVLEVDRLQAVREAIPNTPLNLHGGSGFSLGELSLGAMAGLFQKLNYATQVYEPMIRSIPGMQEALNFVSGQPQGTRPKAGRKKLNLLDPFLQHLPEKVVREAEHVGQMQIENVMAAVRNVDTAGLYEA